MKIKAALCMLAAVTLFGQEAPTNKPPLTPVQIKALQARSALAMGLLTGQEPDPNIPVAPNNLPNPAPIVRTRAAKHIAPEPENVLVAVRTPPLPDNARPALAISERVLNGDPQASTSGDGRVVYMFGKGVYPLICAVGQVTEIDLEPGEEATKDTIDVGNEWLSVAVRQAGARQYLIARALLRDIDTTMTVGTTKGRVYYFHAVSGERPITRIAFSYPEEETARRAAEAKAEEERAVETERLKALAPPAKLVPWKYSTKLHGSAAHLMNPIAIGDDGSRTRIQLSAQVVELGLPTLQIEGPAGPIPANIHWEEKTTLVVDAIFERGCLLYGVGKKQQRVCIEHKGAVERGVN